MINRTYTLLNNLNEQLHFIDLETDNLVHKSEKALEILANFIKFEHSQDATNSNKIRGGKLGVF